MRAFDQEVKAMTFYTFDDEMYRLDVIFFLLEKKEDLLVLFSFPIGSILERSKGNAINPEVIEL